MCDVWRAFGSACTDVAGLDRCTDVAEPTYYWWDFVFCMRKLALCLCAVAFRGRQSTQAVCMFRQLARMPNDALPAFAPIWSSTCRASES
jgi:hypothetical protein